MKSEIVTHLERSEVYRAYQKAFQAATGLPLALREAGCLRSPLHGSPGENPFCALMAKGNATCAACLRLQQKVEEGAAGGACTLRCFAGISESAIPIRMGEKVVAFLQTGQVMFRRPSAGDFLRVLRQLRALGAEVDAAEFREAYFKTRVASRPQYESILRLLGIFAQHLSAICNQAALQAGSAEPPAVAKARAYIAEHQGEELSLTQVARAVNMSLFHFCKTFRKATGLTFVNYVSRRRIESVKQLLADPNRRISEAAFEVGFQSLSQFNRAFKRIVGESPMGYRTRLRLSPEISALSCAA